MGLSCTVSETDRDFGRKSHKFSNPLVFCASAKGVPLELWTGAGVKKLQWWGYQDDKEVWRYLQQSGCNAPTWQTDRDAGPGGKNVTARLLYCGPLCV